MQPRPLAKWDAIPHAVMTSTQGSIITNRRKWRLKRASNKCSHPLNHASRAVTMGNESCLVGGWRQIVLDLVGVSHVDAIASTIGRGPEAYTLQPCPLGGLGGKG